MEMMMMMSMITDNSLVVVRLVSLVVMVQFVQCQVMMMVVLPHYDSDKKGAQD